MTFRPKVSFYILEEAPHAQSLQLTCRLIEKAHTDNHRIYIHTQTTATAEELDNLLWTYRDDSFLPHSLHQPDEEQPAPIQIGCGETFPAHQDTLFNLSQDIPPFYKQFNHIVEIVYTDVNVQQLARERYRRYRDQGCEIETIKLKE